MENIKKIMATVDFSKYSQNVVTVAVDLAQRLNADLMFINVINQRDINAVKRTLYRFPSSDDNISINNYIDIIMDERREKMKSLLNHAGRGKDEFYHLIFKKGEPFEQLVKAAHKEQVDLVVMANKGRTDLNGVLVGYTAEKMFRHCPTMFLCVKEKEPSRVVW